MDARTTNDVRDIKTGWSESERLANINTWRIKISNLINSLVPFAINSH